MARVASRKQHELAGRWLVMKQLCRDVAKECSKGTGAKWRQRETRQRYERIALSLVRRRPMPCLSAQRQIRKEKALERLLQSPHEFALWERDLIAVHNDPSYSTGRRRLALLEANKFRRQHDANDEEQIENLVAATCFRGGRDLSSFYFEPSATRLAWRRAQRGDREFVRRLDAVIRRYLTARENSASWATSLPLLHQLSLEWLHDSAALWRFLDTVLRRWNETSSSKEFSRDLVMHDLLARGERPKSVACDLAGIDAPASKIDQLGARLRKRSARNIARRKLEAECGLPKRPTI